MSCVIVRLCVWLLEYKDNEREPFPMNIPVV